MKHMILVAAVGFLAPGVGTARQFSQVTITSPDAQPNYDFGASFTLSDINQDGLDDLIVMEGNADVGEVTRAGRGWVMMGPDFSVSLVLESNDPRENEHLGSGIVSEVLSAPGIGDVDGDGHIDILIGAPRFAPEGLLEAGRAHLFYGPTFERQIRFQDPSPSYIGRLGFAVMLEDVTKDGLDDVILGSPQVGATPPYGHRAGRVLIWDATELERPLEVLVPRPKPIPDVAEFGDSLAFGDTDGDGAQELIVGAPKLFTPGLGRGQIFIFSVPSLHLKQIVKGPIPPKDPVLFEFGTHSSFGEVIHIGDLSGDSVPDLLALAPFTAHKSGPSQSTFGVITRVDGPDFGYGISIPPYVMNGQKEFAHSSAVADFDQDGHLDVLAGDAMSIGSSGEAWVFWGPEFEDAVRLKEPGLGLPLFGRFVSTGDSDGDGWPEAYVQWPATNGNGKGFIFRYELDRK